VGSAIDKQMLYRVVALVKWSLEANSSLGRSYSRLLAFEAARILFRLGCDVRVYDPAGLPQKDDVQHGHPKVQELRDLSKWSDGHVWISPEQHGNLVSLHRLRWTSELYEVANLRRSKDGYFQAANRLDPIVIWSGAADPGQDSCRCAGQWRVAVVQRRELAANSWSLDAHVCYPQPELCAEGVHTIHF